MDKEKGGIGGGRSGSLLDMRDWGPDLKVTSDTNN